MAHLANSPPLSPVEPVVEHVHDTRITDPYRWLEDQHSPLTRRWLEQQEIYTRAYFATMPGRTIVCSRVRELLSTPIVSELWKVGNQHFYLKRFGSSEQPSIVMKDYHLGEERILVDPSLCSNDNTAAVEICAVSGDGRFLAYSVRRGGTDHASVQILDVQQNRILPDGLPDGFCTGFAFAPDGSGFYYSHRATQDARSNYKAAFRHCFGSSRSEDVEIFYAGEGADIFLGILASAEAALLVYVVLSSGKSPATSVYVQEIPPTAVAVLLFGDLAGCFVPFFAGRHLFAFTDIDAPNSRIVSIDLDRPDPAHWCDIVPESDRRIQQFALVGDQIFVTRVDRFKTCLEAFRVTDGQRERSLFALQGTIDLLTPPSPTDTLFYSCSSVTVPPVVYSYNTKKKSVRLWQEADAGFDPSMLVIEETCYPSRDGMSIPLFLVARKDVLTASPLPTFLTGYGGFGSCATPRFSAFATFLIEQGMLLAVPALRGGSELGEEWHRAGQRGMRQTSFDDFIAAAKWLLSQGRSAEGRIAIGGGSNAGLLVGAAITQRPDLFRAAICLGPLLDMTRYHLFDFAAGWAEEYGSPDDEQDFHSLLSYSPYHRVQDGTEYPAVLLISGDADTRCNPLHARKMTARLQAANRSLHPILLDYKAAWGHTPVQPLSVKIDSLTDRLAFVCHELGVQVQHRRQP